MLSLTPEQIDYKEKTLSQLILNQARLEAGLKQETRPDVIQIIEEQLQDIEAHISRLQDELAGVIVFDNPMADELFMQAVKALVKEKFFLAKKYINKLETIEPFYPGLSRLHQEANAEKASRRTRSIAQGTATSYPGLPAPIEVTPPDLPPEQLAHLEARIGNDQPDQPSRWSHFFQFHIVVSCLVVLLLACIMFGVVSVTVLQWLIEGG